MNGIPKQIWEMAVVMAIQNLVAIILILFPAIWIQMFVLWWILASLFWSLFYDYVRSRR